MVIERRGRGPGGKIMWAVRRGMVVRIGSGEKGRR